MGLLTYSTAEVQELLDTIPTLKGAGAFAIHEAVSGSIAHFADGADGAPVKSLAVDIPSSVSGISTVKVMRAGGNLVKYINSRTSNGITFAYNASTGEVTVSGTATSNAYSDGTASLALAESYTLLAPGNYVAELSGAVDNTVKIYMHLVSLNGTTSLVVNYKIYETFTVTEPCYAYLRLEVSNGVAIPSPITVYPTIYPAAQADTSFVPYNGEEYTIDLGRTIYDAATLDVVNGVLTVGADTYQVAKNEVTTLLGINNIWSDAGDVDVEYCADPKTYIDAQIEAQLGDVETLLAAI